MAHGHGLQPLQIPPTHTRRRRRAVLAACARSEVDGARAVHPPALALVLVPLLPRALAPDLLPLRSCSRTRSVRLACPVPPPLLMLLLLLLLESYSSCSCACSCSCSSLSLVLMLPLLLLLSLPLPLLSMLFGAAGSTTAVVEHHRDLGFCYAVAVI